MDKKQTITKKKLKKLQQDLKDLDMQWITLLVKQMKKDDELDKKFRKVNVRKVYNVFNSIIKDGAWKLQIYKQAGVLKDRLEKELAEAV